VCIVSQRACLPLVPDLAHMTATVIDWCDSFVLADIREIHLLLKTGKLTKLPAAMRALIAPLIEETFYGKYSAANIVVSQADKKCLDRLNQRPHLNHVIHNGVAFPVAGTHEVRKEPNRLIFTGSMSFPPNYNGALWFIEHVMPLLTPKNKEIRLVVAGQEPISELLSKADEHIKITGLVPDIRAEIAKSQLYVAPLISGTGFRNKVVEAIASGTYVIGTPMALEFLDVKLRSTLLIATTAKEFAVRIEEFLKDPRAFDDRLNEAVRIVREDYQWASRVKELENLCRQAIEQQARLRR
jgi:glycosyltransferase involved in cell wall biosynthesis